MRRAYDEGDTIGRYQIIDVLGDGAMARVYRAYDPDIGRTVAIKVLRDELLSDTEYVSRFLREARSAGALAHPNIVTVFDVGDVDGAPYIAMECVEGEPLSTRLRAGERFSIGEALEIVRQVAEALDFAHRHGVVHRDVKPSNVLFTADTGTVKLADFGIARIETAEDAEHTQSGAVMGTPRYMSPEHAAGDTVDARSDLFSLGVILYEMLAGRCPFTARTTAGLLLEITTKDPQPVRKLAPDTPVGTARIVGRLLYKNPDKRFQSGGHLARALAKEHDALLEHEHERERNKYVPLKLKWTGAIGLVVAAVMLVTALTVYQLQREQISRVILDSGTSLAQYVAFDVATPLLSEDWVTLEAMVEEANRRESFRYVIVTDHEGTVRAATDEDRVGDRRELPGETDRIREISGVRVSEIDLGDGGSALNFSAPARFQDKRVGTVDLGLSRKGLDSVMAHTRWLLFFQGVVIIGCVVGVLYVFGILLARPIDRLRRAMSDFAAGDTSARISVTRNDEFGVLYNAFNEMAERLSREPDSTLLTYDGDAATEQERTTPGEAGDRPGSGDDDDDVPTTVLDPEWQQR